MYAWRVRQRVAHLPEFMPQRQPAVVPPSQLRRGYEISIDNAIRLSGAAARLLQEYPDKALALAQLGQEEVGKSLSLLAAGALPPDPQAWAWLWTGWRDHQLKAHRAYLYEIIHPLRLEFSHPDHGERYDGGPLLERLSDEKEVGFYVDYDANLGAFVSPEEMVDETAAVARISTVTYLAATADAVRRGLMHTDHIYRFDTFADVALTICTREIYQQDWPAMRAAFGAKSTRHGAILHDIDTALKGTAAFFKQATSRGKAKRHNRPKEPKKPRRR